MRESALSCRAIILRKINYREADLVVTLLTERHGRVSALARAGRQSARRYGGGLGVFSLCAVRLERGKGSLWNLTEAVLIEPHLGLAAELVRLERASALVELCLRVTPEEHADDEPFAALAVAIGQLEHVPLDGLDAAAIAGELALLAAAGTGVCASACYACGKPVPQGRKAYFHPARGGVVCAGCGGGPFVLSAEAARALGALAGDPGPLPWPLSKAAAAELFQALLHFSDYHVDGSRRRTSSVPPSSYPPFDPRSQK